MAKGLSFRRNRFAMGLVIVGLAFWGLSSTAYAAGCHTACTLSAAPDCLGCGFVAFSNIMCTRAGCDTCFEDSCSYLVIQGEQSASKSPVGQRICPSPAAQPVPLRVVKVETLSSRG